MAQSHMSTTLGTKLIFHSKYWGESANIRSVAFTLTVLASVLTVNTPSPSSQKPSFAFQNLKSMVCGYFSGQMLCR
ncbi:hypothetical protein Pfo_027805 [Paulownia fortunei]|nr:hypothetical protein Pfo_027805 [Paulownia fortunei]